MSIYIDELKPLRLYRKRFYTPIYEKNKKQGSVIFLLSPNLTSSKSLMSTKFMINTKKFESYYLEKDINFIINSENMLLREPDSNTVLHEAAIVLENTDYKIEHLREEFKLDALSLRIKLDESSCIMFFNESLDAEFEDNNPFEDGDLLGISEAREFRRPVGAYNQQLRKLLYKERIRNNKIIMNLYKDIRKTLPFIKKTYLNYNQYHQLNLFIDWSYYTSTFFRNNMYKLDRGIDLYFDFVTRFINDNRLVKAGYHKKTVFIPVNDWILSGDEISTWDYKKSLNPISMMYRLMRKDINRLKTNWGGIDFVFIASSGYFKVDFNNFKFKDITYFLKHIKSLVLNEPIIDDEENVESPKAIVDNIVKKIEDSQSVKINNLTGGTDEISVEDIKKKSELGLSSNRSDEKKAELVQMIKKVADKSLTTEEAIDNLDNDDNSEFFKKLLLDLESEEDNTPKLTKARSTRMVELNADYNQKIIRGSKVKDLLEKNKTNTELKPLNIEIDSINEDWKEVSFPSFEKQYDLNSDIAVIIDSFKDKSLPLSIKDITSDDSSTSEDDIETLTINYEDSFGKRFNVKLDIPKFKNNRFMRLRGNEKTINGQLMLLPISKTDNDTVQIVSNYNKIFVRRFNISAGKSNVYTDVFIKALEKYDGGDIKISYGDNSSICNKYDLPIDYVDLASIYSKIESHDITIYFNQDEIRKIISELPKTSLNYEYIMKDFKNPNKIPFAINKNGQIDFLDGFWMASYTIGMKIANPHQDGTHNAKFYSLLQTIKPSSRYTYSKASILNAEIPVIVIASYSEGLQRVLQKANVNFTITEKRESVGNKNRDHIKFKDGYLYYNINYTSSMLMNGLKECNTEEYSIKDLNNKRMWLDFLDQFGGRIKADGLDNFYDLMVDPITKEICEHYKLPTDYISLLLYGNMLLADNKFNKHTDITGNRFRTNEIVAGYIYKCLANAYGDYKNQLKRNRKNATMSMKQSAVIDALMLDPTTSDLSILNPLLEVETANSVSFKGLSGMNSDRSYGLDKRTYDKSMTNKLAMATGFAANVGITRQATIDMDVEGVRGYIKSNDDESKMSITKTLSMTEALTPLGTTRDDPFRSAMTFIQTSKHSMRTKKTFPSLVTTGADEALPYLTSDTFAFKAKDDGRVIDINDKFVVVEYKNKTRDYISLEPDIKKNSDGGFFLSVKLDSDKKRGNMFKKNDILAYDKTSYSHAIGNTNVNNPKLSYSIGTLAKIAIMNTDEGYEDSAIISEYLSESMASEIIVCKDIVIPKTTTILNMVKKGQKIQDGDTLITLQSSFEEEDINILLRSLTDDMEAITELGRINIKSKVTGTVKDIKVYRTVENIDLSPSLKKLVKEYDGEIIKTKNIFKKNDIADSNKRLEADYKLDPIGKLKNAKESVLIEFYLEYDDKMGIGDKLVYYSALKGVVKDIFPKGDEPYTDFRPDEKIQSLLAISSVNARMVSSIITVGAINKVLIELDRKVKDIMKVPYTPLDKL